MAQNEGTDLRTVTPPNSVEAEISVLGAMLLDSTAVLRATENLKKEDFYLPEHQEIYDAMAALHRDRKPVDLTTVDAELARRGTLDEVALYPREVVEQALQAHAHAVILAHNHPGGTPYPSSADVETTHRVVDALGIVGIRALDHVIISGGAAYSMASGGLIENGRLSSGTLRAGSAVSAARPVPGLGWEADRP